MNIESLPQSKKKLSIFTIPKRIAEPKPAEFQKPARFPFLSIFLIVAALILAFGYLVIPNTETEPQEEAKQNPKNRPVHGNSNDNDDLHKVYEIFIIEIPYNEITLKYGITSQKDFVTKDGNPRPEYQIPNILKNPEYADKNISYKYHYENVKGRVLAKQLEQELVNKYYATYGQKPPLQERPIPDLMRQK